MMRGSPRPRRIAEAVVRAAALALAAIVVATGPAAAQQKPLQKVKLAIGGPVLNITHPYLEMPKALNYWRDEGYDVDVITGGSSFQAIQVLNAGNLDFVEINGAPLIQAANSNGLPIRSIMVNTVIDWSVTVPDDSPYKDIKDLKSKLVGTSNLGSGAVGLLQSYLTEVGLDSKDVTLVAVGPGPTALEALRAGRVQGLMYWGAANASFEVAGEKMRYFYDPRWRRYPDFGLATLQATIEKDPKMVVAIVRGSAMASLFALTNPECVRKLQWAHFPDTKPTGDTDANLAKGDLHRLDFELESMQQARALGGSELWGKVLPENYADLENFLLATKLIDHKLANPDGYMVAVPDFWTKVNDFDHAAVEAQAKACQMS